ncbi:MAG: GTP 3',8-cyclase MoaA [Burkholderiales bacterium]|nr:GTP 3',8-cyclase MoaA [Burkholderiales bacterium]
MAERVIPLVQHRVLAPRATVPVERLALQDQLQDTRGRLLRDLRISVTDRCNFRCSYCMPKEVFDSEHAYLPHAALLSFEEIARLARVFVQQGVQKIRLTGGEPLLRKNLEALVAQLAPLKTPEGRPLDLTLTTNGTLLARKARQLREAGLKRVTVSLDALDDRVFRRMNDVDFPVAEVLRGIDAAQAAGLGPIKVNMVVKRGTNDHEIVPMARHFRGSGVVLRFIEYMDVGASNGWRMDEVLPGAEVIQRLRSEWPMVALPSTAAGETAQRWGYADAFGRHDPGLGEIGLINSVTQAFCGDCNRARLSTDGAVYTCLFATVGHDLRSLVRGDERHPAGTDADLAAAIRHLWLHRSDRYSEIRGTVPHRPPAAARRIEMSYIGG